MNDNKFGYLNIKEENILILSGNVKLVDYGMNFFVKWNNKQLYVSGII